MRKVHFPRLVIPLSVVLTTYMNFVLNFVAVVVFMLASGIEPRLSWLQISRWSSAWGCCDGHSDLLSALFVRYRDVAADLGRRAQMRFYGSPILYPVESIPDEGLQHLIMCNPLAVIVQQARHAIVDPSAPSAAEAIGGAQYLLIPFGIIVRSCASWATSSSTARPRTSPRNCDVRACTIVAAAELPHARALAGSFAQHHADAELTALVLDGSATGEPFEVLEPRDLDGLDTWKLYGLGAHELRRYLEPFLLARFEEPVVLLAPDVRVGGPLDALLTGGAALVPRVLEPAGEEALAGGLYDSGVLGWGPQAERVLAWWRERVEERLREESGGPHVLDAAPALFEEVTVVRDPAYGVADWNLDEPGRSAEGARTLRERAAEAPEDSAPLARLHHGVVVDDALRDVIRDAAGRGIELSDLDTEEGTHRLLEWANGPADRGAVQGVTRYLLALHGRRLDLHDTFRALEDDDGEAFVHWARTTGRADGIPDVLLPLPAPESAAPQGPPPLGVNVAGYLRTGLGVGEAARLYVAALEAAQVPVRTETADPGLGIREPSCTRSMPAVHASRSPRS